MKTLLVMTVGRTDVQLVVDDVRQELHKEYCGELHDELANRGFTIVDVPRTKDKERQIEVLPDGDLRICTPKLDAVLRYFGESLPPNALVLDTRRMFKSEPRLAGTVLEQKLEDRAIPVRLHTYLRFEDRFDDREKPEDAVVRRSVVADLSKVIAEEISRHQPTRVFLATTGGPPPVIEVINELTRLHAVGRADVLALDTPENANVAIEEKFHPAAGFRARWHALSLIEKGNLLGAWGAVSHLQGIPGQGWTQVIKWLSQFASSMPFEPPLPSDSDLMVLNHERMAVRAALRVELALRAGDIPRAVQRTVAFFEAGLWDWLRQRDFNKEDGAAGSLESGFTFAAQPTGEKKKRFTKNGKINDFKEGVDAWLPVLGKPSLTAFWTALSDEVRNLRNDVAHNEPTRELMNEARTLMQTAGVWSNNDTFLSQPLVQAVLTELGEPTPEQLCINLMLTVRERLIAIS